MSEAGSEAPEGHRGRPRRARRLLVPALVAVAAFLVALTAWQGFSAYRHLQSVQRAVPDLRTQLTEGDQAAARRTAAAVAGDARAARADLDGPVWDLLARLPAVGATVGAAQQATAAADDLAAGPLATLVDLSADLDPARLRPREGRVDVGLLRSVSPAVSSASDGVRAARGDLDDVPLQDVVGPVRRKLEAVRGEVRRLDGLLRVADRALQVLPGTLGADGPRTYLVLVQNNSEPRSLGGIVGSMVLVRTDDGRISLLGQRSASSFGDLGEPVPLTRGERALYGTPLGRFFQNVTDTPDFPRAAELATEMWERGGGRRIDGVASMDPVALASLLRATGPVTLPDGTVLAGDDAAATLLNGVYTRIPDGAAQDAFFGLAASGVFETLAAGRVDVRTAAEALAASTRQGRLLFWPTDRTQQEVLAGTPLAGRLVGHRGDRPVLGVYLHDRTEAKLAYYQDMAIEARPVSCRADGSRLVTVRVRLASRVPADVRAFGYQNGGGRIVPVGRLASQVYVYAPSGGTIVDFRISEGRRTVVLGEYDGLEVASKRIDLRRGQAVTAEVDVEIPSRLAGELEIRHTPGPGVEQFSARNRPCPS